MQSHAVVEANDVIGSIGLRLAMVGIVTLPHAFHLEVQEESLHHGIVPTATFAAHTGNQPVLCPLASNAIFAWRPSKQSGLAGLRHAAYQPERLTPSTRHHWLTVAFFAVDGIDNKARIT